MLATTSSDATIGGLDPMVAAAVAALVLLAGAMVLAAMWLRARAPGAAAPAETARHRVDAVRARSAAEDEVDLRIADMLDVARRLSAQLDSKAARLEALLARTEEAVESLASRIETARAGHAGSPETPAAPAEQTAANTVTLDSALPDEIIRLAEQGFSVVEIAQRLDESIGKVELILALRRQSRPRTPAT